MEAKYGDVYYDCRSDGDVDIEAAYPHDPEAMYPTTIPTTSALKSHDLPPARLMAGKHWNLKAAVQPPTTYPQEAAALFQDIEAATGPRDIETATARRYLADPSLSEQIDVDYNPRYHKAAAVQRDIEVGNLWGDIPASATLSRDLRAAVSTRREGKQLEQLKPRKETQIIEELQPNLKDAWKIREVVERVAAGAHHWLHNVGGKCNVCGGIQKERHTISSSSYPATLELSARLYSDKSTQRQGALRGDPVKLKLPVELNPHSGQIKVNVFRPRSVSGEGDKRGLSPPPTKKAWGSSAGGATAKTLHRSEGKVKKSMRKVRWPDINSVRGQFGELIFD